MSDAKATDPIDTPVGEPIDLDGIIQQAVNYADGVFSNTEMATPDQTALACAILGAACMPQPLGADDVAGVLGLAVSEILTAIGTGKMRSGIGMLGN